MLFFRPKNENYFLIFWSFKERLQVKVINQKSMLFIVIKVRRFYKTKRVSPSKPKFNLEKIFNCVIILFKSSLV